MDVSVVLAYEALTGGIIAAAIEVHSQLGPGFLETVYEAAMSIELSCRGIPFRRQLVIPLSYRGQSVGSHRLDLLVADTIVVELKAIKALEDVHFAVVRSYLRVMGCEHGLLMNFSGCRLEVKRVRVRPLRPPPSPGFLGSSAVSCPGPTEAFDESIGPMRKEWRTSLA